MKKGKPMMDDSEFQIQNQPEPWESFLRDITVPLHHHEKPYDPTILSQLVESSETAQLFDGPVEVYRKEECVRQIELIRKITARKLKGIQRKCLLLLLATNAQYRQIAEWLQVSDDTVLRSIKSAVEQIKPYLEEMKLGEFPTGRGRRPRIRVSLFPLDTVEEKIEFQAFLNTHTVRHVSYHVDDLFREALVVYKYGKWDE